MGQLVMLRPSNPATFRRSVRNAKGEVTDTLVFPPDQPVELTDEQCKVIADDLGAAVVLASTKKQGGRTMHKPEWELTESAVREIASQAQKLGLPLRPHQREALAGAPEPKSKPPAAPAAAKTAAPKPAEEKAPAEKPAAKATRKESAPSSKKE